MQDSFPYGGVDYKKYLQSQEWQEVRKKFLKSQCKKCGGKKRLGLHHLTYRNLGCELEEDVRTLCWFCHKKEHIQLNSLNVKIGRDNRMEILMREVPWIFKKINDNKT